MRLHGVAPSRRAARAGLLTGTLIVALLALAWSTAPGAARGAGSVAAVTPTPLTSPYFTETPSAPAPTAVAPVNTTNFTPGSAYLQPGGSVSFLDQTQRQSANGSPSGPRLLKVVDGGSDSASVSFDGRTLVVTGGSFPRRAAVAMQVPGANCTPLDADGASVGCTPIHGDPSLVVMFTTSSLPDARPGMPYLPVSTYQALALPGDDTIAPKATELLLSAASVGPSLSRQGLTQPVVATVRNDGADPITLADDGTTLTLSGPDDDILAASGEISLATENPGNVRAPLVCTAGDTSNVLVCPNPTVPATIDLLAQPAAAFVAPGEATLYLGQNAAFRTTSGDAAGRSLVVRYVTLGGLFGAPEVAANAVVVSWDGKTLTVNGPPTAYVMVDCAPQMLPSTAPNSSVSCDLSQSAQTLVTIESELPSLMGPGGPPPQQPRWSPVILSAPASGAVGDALNFTGSAGGLYSDTADGPFAYFWLWDDGMVDTGAIATHSYAAVGTYSVAFVGVNLHDGTLQSAWTTVTIAGP